ncbi:MAG: hypothetical protein IBX69_16695 [Anaerolineales bacterium]|nr:hypothetical protein [Anaerolineales bacterium]
MSIGDVILALPVWWINGVLAMLYWSIGHLPEFAATLAGAIILLGIDPILQQRAGERPRRQGRGEAQTSGNNAQYFTLATLIAWLLVSFTSRFPVPLIGACLWWVGLLAILAVPEERFNQLWWAKTGLLVYAGLALLLRYGLVMLNQVNPADWASVVGSRLDAQAVLATTRGNIAMIGMLFVFVLYPLGYFSLLFNRFLRNPKPLYAIGLEAGDVIRRLRTR